MGFPVVSFTASATGSERMDWTDEDYNGLFVTKALKRKPFRGRCTVRISGQQIGVRSGEREVALRWFANVAHRYLFDSKIETPIALVPLPALNAVDMKASCDTSEQAAELAGSIGKDAYVLDCVRWKEAITGEHDARYYYEQAVAHPNTLTRGLPKTTVLVDEIFTDGATIRAVVARLRENGIKIDMALCAAHVPPGRIKEVFQAHKHSIDLGV